jgi:uncharacterized protein (UPF0335 family)
MTQSNDPDDRQLRALSRRVDRLEYTQISPQEFSRSFDALEDIVNERFDRVENHLRELNRKFDIVMQYITGQGGNP